MQTEKDGNNKSNTGRRTFNVTVEKVYTIEEEYVKSFLDRVNNGVDPIDDPRSARTVVTEVLVDSGLVTGLNRLEELIRQGEQEDYFDRLPEYAEEATLADMDALNLYSAHEAAIREAKDYGVL